MRRLQFVPKHNEVAYLEKSDAGDGPKFHQIVEFLNTTHIRYALTCSPKLYKSQIRRFWKTANVKTNDDGEKEIHATVDGKELVVCESSIRRHLKLADLNGVHDLPNKEILENIKEMGYDTSNGKLTFIKGCFPPQWRFFIHTLLHCLSPKKTSWDQFGSNIAVALICLSTNRTYNFSRLIFDHMVRNLQSKTKFLMYPRFVQVMLNKRGNVFKPSRKTFSTPRLKKKVFQNMSRSNKLFKGDFKPLFPHMLEKIGHGEGLANEADHLNSPTVVPNSVNNSPVINTNEIRTNNVSVVPQTISPPPNSVPEVDMNHPNMNADKDIGIRLVGGEESSDSTNPTETATHKAAVPEVDMNLRNMDAGKGIGISLMDGEESSEFTNLAETATHKEAVPEVEMNLHNMDAGDGIGISLVAVEESSDFTKRAERETQNEADRIGLDTGGENQMEKGLVGGSAAVPLTTRVEIECMSKDAPPPIGNTSASVVDSHKVSELMELCTTLSTTVSVLQDDLNDTKKLYKRVYIKLVEKVKRQRLKLNQLKSERKSKIPDSPESSGFGEVDMRDFDETNCQTEIPNKGMHIEQQKEEFCGGLAVCAGKETDNRCLENDTVDIDREEIRTRENNRTNKHICNDAEHARKLDICETAKPVEGKKMAKSDYAGVFESDGQKAQRMAKACEKIDTDPILRDKYMELQSNENLTIEEKCRILADFAKRRDDVNAINDLLKPIRQCQKNYNRAASNPTGPTMGCMKNFIVKHGRVSRDSLKGKTYQEITSMYYAERKKSVAFENIVGEDAGRAVKRAKIGNERFEMQGQARSNHKINNTIALVPECLNVNPIRSKHPIVGWEIVREKNGKLWKIKRAGGKIGLFKEFEDLVRSCDRQDLDALWLLVRSKVEKGNSYDVKEQELIAEMTRLYQPDPTDIQWSIPCHPFMKISWKLYSSCNVHHLKTDTGSDVFMLTDKEYPLSRALLSYMASSNIENQTLTDEVKALKERIADQFSRAIVY